MLRDFMQRGAVIQKEYNIYDCSRLEGKWFKIVYSSNKYYYAVHYRIISKTEVEAYSVVGGEGYVYKKYNDPYSLFSAKTIQRLYNRGRADHEKLNIYDEPSEYKYKSTRKLAGFKHTFSCEFNNDKNKELKDKELKGLEETLAGLKEALLKSKDEERSSRIQKEIDKTQARINNILNPPGISDDIKHLF